MPATNEPRFASYKLENAHTGEVVSTHDTRAEAKAALTAANDHALRVRGDMSARVWEDTKQSFFERMFFGGLARWGGRR